MNLTPYDTGAVAEPKLWQKDRFELKDTMKHGDPDDIGKVDFENDSGETLAIVRVIRDEGTGHYVLQLDKWDDDITVEVI